VELDRGGHHRKTWWDGVRGWYEKFWPALTMHRIGTGQEMENQRCSWLTQVYLESGCYNDVRLCGLSYSVVVSVIA